MNKTNTILIVEDNDDDVYILKYALRKAGNTLDVQVVVDGQAAIDYIGGTGIYSNRAEHPSPSVIFLDLKLPFLTGHEILRWTREESSIPSIPVVILSGSDESRDRELAKTNRATDYLVKPASPNDLRRILELLGLIEPVRD